MNTDAEQTRDVLTAQDDGTDRLNACEGIVVLLAEIRVCDERCIRDQNRISIRRGAGDRLGRDHGCGAWPVFHDRRYSLPSLSVIGEHAGKDTAATSGRISNHKLYGPCRLRVDHKGGDHYQGQPGGSSGERLRGRGSSSGVSVRGCA